MKHLLPILILFFLSSKYSHAKDLDWFQTTALIDASPQWAVFAEIQPRWLGGYNNTQSILLRSAVLFSIKPGLRIGLGFGHTPQFLPYIRNENRLFQQLDWMPGSFNSFELSSRLRLEERFLERTAGIAWRAREKLQLNFMPSQFGVYIWDEAFFNLNTLASETSAGLDQNRLSFGPRLKQPTITLEAGFLIQTLVSSRKLVSWNTGVLLNTSLKF